MKRRLFVLIISIFSVCCQEKTKAIEKTYEQLEAEVLCDVLPEIAKYELQNSYLQRIPPPPPELDSKKYSKLQIDSIVTNNDLYWKEISIKHKENIDSIIEKLNHYKKVEFGVLDTLRWVNKYEIDNTQYLFDSLGIRPLNIDEFEKSNLKIILITYKNTFEGGIRNLDIPLLFPSRVLISQNYKKAYFYIFKYYHANHVFCEFSEQKNKWIVKEIIEE